MLPQSADITQLLIKHSKTLLFRKLYVKCVRVPCVLQHYCTQWLRTQSADMYLLASAVIAMLARNVAANIA